MELRRLAMRTAAYKSRKTVSYILNPNTKIMSFDEYLTAKKIDSQRFKQTDPTLYTEWAVLFEVVHPDSFTVQKKFLLNALRRQYLLNSEGRMT